MKKMFSLVIVLFAATGLSVGFRQGVSGTSEASRREPSPERLDRADRLDRPLALEGAAATIATDEPDAEYARVAAAAGDRLLERAKQSPGNPHLLRQATAHYRAALAHEPTARNAGRLFAAVREKLASVDRMGRPGLAKATPKPSAPPAVVKTTPPPLAPDLPAPRQEATRRVMYGPDGVEIRRAGSPD